MTEAEMKKSKILKNIRENYTLVERSIVEQLYMKQELHGPTIGRQREDIWKQLFEMIIPKKFSIEQSAFIIDSTKKGISREVDLVIFDETYTPYIFRYGQLKFIPIEAVAAVVECKSQDPGNNDIKNLTESIEQLKTSDRSIARTVSGVYCNSAMTQSATRPIRIFCGLKESAKSVTDEFDFILIASKEERLCIKIKVNINRSMEEWYKELNHFENEISIDGHFKDRTGKDFKEDRKDTLEKYKVEGESEISLLSFNFQFNQLLMLINNPMLFPHRAYVDMFNEK